MRYEIYTAPSDLLTVKEALEQNGVKILSADRDMIADTDSELDEKQQETILKMIEKLEENDDVQNVYHNAIITINQEDED